MKKLTKRIKKSVIKQIENDIKESILNKIYGSDSKKQIKKLRKKLYKEIQKEIFGELEVELTNELQESIVQESEEKKEEESEHERGKIIEYKGFKFDVDRMSSIVTGKTKKINEDIETTKAPKLSEKEKKDISNMHKLIGIKSNEPNNIPRHLLRGISKAVQFPSQFSPFPTAISPGNNRAFTSVNKKIIKPTFPEISIEKKEEVNFFIGKLKDGIDKLKSSEKNINYRKRKDEIYTFSYEKLKDGALDFSLKFDLDLNIYTYGATINSFEFNVDGFKFNEKIVEILDIIAVLDTVGMSLSKYIGEITNINSSATDSKLAIKNNLNKNVKAIRANTKLGKFIFDNRIKNLLMSNDIKTYGQLKKIEDLTALKGIGSKTADKIEEFIKK